jgi:hypothetical protein
LVFPMRFGDPVVGLRRRYSPRKPGGRLPTLRLPTRLGVPFKLVWFYYTQRRAGHPRSCPSPLRGDITRALPYAMIFCPFRALMLRIDTVYR